MLTKSNIVVINKTMFNNKVKNCSHLSMNVLHKYLTWKRTGYQTKNYKNPHQMLKTIHAIKLFDDKTLLIKNKICSLVKNKIENNYELLNPGYRSAIFLQKP